MTLSKSNIARAKSRFSKKYDAHTVKWSYIMLAPEYIGFLVFSLYPILWALRLSWFSYDGTPSATRFVGWTNFINLFTNDATYWKSFLTTFEFAIMKVPFEMVLALLLALALSRNIKGISKLRTFYFIPNVISVAIIGLIFSNMFSYYGFVNSLLLKLGIISDNIDWFEHKFTALITLVLADTWHSFGINMLYFIAALTNVPAELYESAKMDGAGSVVCFFKITLPSIAPVFKIVIMLSLIGTLSTSDIVLVLTGGAPGGQTYTVMPYIVSNFVPGFAGASANIGYGCSMSMVTAIIMALVAAVHNRITKSSD